MKKIIAIIIILVIAVGGYFYFSKNKNEDAKKTKLMTAKVEKKDIEVVIKASGSITPFTRVEVKSTVTGRITELFKDEGDVVKEGDILATVSAEDRNIIIDAAKANMRDALANNDKDMIAEAKAALEIAEKAYKPVSITAPIDGEIINRAGQIGQNANLSSVMFVIADRLTAVVNVDEVDIGKIKNGMKAHINLESFPDSIVEGRVVKISREGNIVSDVVQYEIMVEPEKVPEKWASGMTANVDFILASKKDVLAAPLSSIKEGRKEGSKYVNVKTDEGIKKFNVTTGIDDGKFVEINGDILPGDVLVITEIKEKEQTKGMFMRGRH